MLIKICGMREQKLIDLAADLGADMCGFVFYPPSPRSITPGEAAALDTHGMKRVGVFVTQSLKETQEAARTARLDYVQLHGGQGMEFSRIFPSERIIRVLFPKKYAGAEALQAEVDRLSGSCGMFLVDAGLGSGNTLDWQALAGVRFPLPWLLSGGLGHENVAAALNACRPDGIDMNSRLESIPGRKDAVLMKKAIEAARNR
ncbi:MAG: phosphoribosylanthranilate isomerase [Mailhella sp.]|nr:phosphoribosylanthranilate isomerase [Mailhella sp.]